MKYLAVLAPLLLAVASLAIPPNCRCQNVAKDAQAHQQPSQTQSAPSKQQPSTTPDQRPAPENVQTTNEPHPVAVKEMPPKEIWDKVYVILTAVLVAVGIGTFIAVAVQAIQTKKAAEAARDSVGEIKRQVGIMDGQLKEMRDAKEIQTKTLVLQFRPKLKVRGGEVEGSIVAPMLQPATATVEFFVINSGGSPAHITASFVNVKAVDFGVVPPLWDDAQSLGRFSLKAGEEILKTISVSAQATQAIQWEDRRQWN